MSNKSTTNNTGPEFLSMEEISPVKHPVVLYHHKLKKECPEPDARVRICNILYGILIHRPGIKATLSRALGFSNGNVRVDGTEGRYAAAILLLDDQRSRLCDCEIAVACHLNVYEVLRLRNSLNRIKCYIDSLQRQDRSDFKSPLFLQDEEVTDRWEQELRVGLEASHSDLQTDLYLDAQAEQCKMLEETWSW